MLVQDQKINNMKVSTISQDNSLKLRQRIESNIRSIQKRGITYTIFTHSDRVASIAIIVSGRRGIGQIDMVVAYDEMKLCWVIHCQGQIFELASFSEIGIVAKRKIVQMQVSLRKF